MEDNYIKLINRFWKSSIERAFNPSDCQLYFYLLNTCNSLYWKQPFGQSDRHLSLAIGMSVPTIREAKCRLKQRGLIDFKAPHKGSKAFDGQTKYCFPESTDSVQKFFTDTYTVTSTDALSETDTEALTNYKQKETQPNNRVVVEIDSVVLPFTSNKFTNVWTELVTSPYWKTKSVRSLQIAANKLKSFDEEFAIELIEESIVGNWKGLVFPDTQQRYENLQKRKQNGKTSKSDIANSESKQRKEAIIRRAAYAVAECSNPSETEIRKCREIPNHVQSEHSATSSS